MATPTLHPVKARTAAFVVGHTAALTVTGVVWLVLMVGLSVWAMYLADSCRQPEGPYNDGPYIGPWICCACALGFGAVNVGALLLICHPVAWFLGDRGGPIAQLWAPAALLALVGCLTVATVAINSVTMAGQESFAALPGVGWPFASIQVLLLLTYWVTLSAVRWGHAGKVA